MQTHAELLPIPAALADEPRLQDDIVALRPATWADYQRLLELRGERSVPRLTYLEGTLEIMSPSPSHESIKSNVGRLVEVYCLENDVVFQTLGSWTLERKDVERGAEPDECYVFHGRKDATVPDLAIEVVWTSGGLDKLQVYSKLGVPEVWTWKRDVLHVHVLRGGGYEAVEASVALPGIDLVQLAAFATVTPTSEAMQGYRKALIASR